MTDHRIDDPRCPCTTSQEFSTEPNDDDFPELLLQNNGANEPSASKNYTNTDTYTDKVKSKRSRQLYTIYELFNMFINVSDRLQ